MANNLIIEFNLKTISFINFTLGVTIGLTHSIIGYLFGAMTIPLVHYILASLAATLIAGIALAFYSVIFFVILKRTILRAGFAINRRPE